MVTGEGQAGGEGGGGRRTERRGGVGGGERGEETMGLVGRGGGGVERNPEGGNSLFSVPV